MNQRTPIEAERLRAALGPRWARVVVVGETESTNADLLADVDAPDRSVLVAEHQAAGRGRLERTWTSPPGAGLTFSVLLRLDVPIATWGWLPLLAGVALRDAVVAEAGVDATLKWPNDLLCGPSELKLAGILAQTSGEAVIVGIGLNVTTTADELPVETATSLQLCGTTSVNRTALLAAILAELDRRLVQWSAAGGDAEACRLAADYRAACATLGRRVAVAATDGTALTGEAIGIDSEGRLRVDVDGSERIVGAGDVVHLRPA